MSQLSGILPALVTPLDGDSLHRTSLEALIARVYEAGADGLYLCGSTGEGLVLPVEMREQITEIAVAASTRSKQVVVHVGAYRTTDTLRLTRHASRLGVAAVSSLPPGTAYDFGETRAYYEAIAGAASVPLLVYHFPSLAPPFSLDQIEELCNLPGVAGLKFTSFDLYSLRQLRLGNRVVFNGHDEVLAAGLLMGAVGGIGSTYNLAPQLFADLYRHATAGRWTEAIRVQDRVNSLIRILLGFPWLPAIKRILSWSGIECGEAVLPRRTLTPQEEERLRALYTRWESGG